MKRAIIAVLLLHFVLVGFCFGFAIHDPGRSGLLPILVYFADYPASLLAEWLRRALYDSIGRSLFTDALAYLSIGSAWWLLLGLLVERLICTVFTRAP